MYRLCILFMYLFILACNNSNKVYPIHKFFKDSIIIVNNKIPKFSTGHLTYCANTTPAIFFYIDAIAKKSYTIQQENNEYILVENKNIENFFIKNKIFSSTIINKDSVYSLSEFSSYLYLTNIDGTILHKWNLDNLKDKNNDMIGFRGISNSSPLVQYDSLLYLYNIVYLHDEEEARDYNKTDLITCLKIHADSLSVVTTFGKVPPSESKILLGQTFSKRTICQYEKSVLFSYSTSKYVYQFKNGELCDSFLMQANHFTPPNIDFDYMNGGNKDNLGSYSSKFSFYNNIFCNENFIMRIASNPYKEIDKDGNFVFPVNKSWSMIISDTKFNLIYEIAVPEYLLDFTTCMQTDKGFYIRSLKKSSVLYYYEVFK